MSAGREAPRRGRWITSARLSHCILRSLRCKLCLEHTRAGSHVSLGLQAMLCQTSFKARSESPPPPPPPQTHTDTDSVLLDHPCPTTCCPLSIPVMLAARPGLQPPFYTCLPIPGCPPGGSQTVCARHRRQRSDPWRPPSRASLQAGLLGCRGSGMRVTRRMLQQALGWKPQVSSGWRTRGRPGTEGCTATREIEGAQ